MFYVFVHVVVASDPREVFNKCPPRCVAPVLVDAQRVESLLHKLLAKGRHTV